MILSERKARLVLSLYPPLFFQRISVKNFGKGFTSAEVRIRKSLFNRNYNKTIFGGTIFSAVDPVFVFMYWQILTRKGIKVQCWLKSATIDYRKPGDTDLTVLFSLSENDIADALSQLNERGTYVRKHTVQVINARKEVCALAEVEVYIRRATKTGETISGF
ncbi:MAG TPA: YiiD C-terminal domain-containing protein [Anseongella sp.]